MGKYDILREHLKYNVTGKCKFTFERIEQILGFTLFPSAYKYSEFWNNGSQNPFSKAWLEAGYIQECLNLGGRTVSFVQNKDLAEKFLLKAQQKKKKS